MEEKSEGRHVLNQTFILDHTFIRWTLPFLGFWMIAFALTFETPKEPIFFSDLIAGVLLCLFFFCRRKDHLLLAGAIGVWLEVAPLLFWAKNPATYLNDTVIGILVILVAVILPSYAREESVSPTGWSYNPSTWKERFPIMLFSFLALCFARYMAAFQLGYINTVWDPFFGDGTEKVITSAISKSFPVSDAGMGAFAYTIEFLMTCHGGISRWKTHPWFVLAFGFLVVPVGLVSIVLIALQPLAVGAWCFWCLAAAFCMFLMALFALDEVVAAIQTLSGKRK